MSILHHHAVPTRSCIASVPAIQPSQPDALFKSFHSPLTPARPDSNCPTLLCPARCPPKSDPCFSTQTRGQTSNPHMQTSRIPASITSPITSLTPAPSAVEEPSVLLDSHMTRNNRFPSPHHSPTAQERRLAGRSSPSSIDMINIRGRGPNPHPHTCEQVQRSHGQGSTYVLLTLKKVPFWVRSIILLPLNYDTIQTIPTPHRCVYLYTLMLMHKHNKRQLS